MGIPKLTGFILHNFTEWRHVTVCNGNLVIDGYSLCYNLYFQHYKWEMGGEYCEFYSTVLEYCRGLKSLGIDAYIVMDGIDFDDSKKASHEKRCEQKFERIADMQSGRVAQERTVQFSLLPLFAKAVFRDAIHDSGLKFFVADGEADQSIVALANYLGCPVLGNDSDFFIFEIQGGYIPITDRNDLVDLSSPVKCFKLSDFVQKFALHGDQRLFLPLILGNDFHDGCAFPRLSIDSKTPVHKTISKVKQSLHTIEDAARFGGPSALAQMKSIKAFYNVQSQSFADLSSSRALHTTHPFVASWILDLYKQGQFSPNVLHMILSKSKVWRYLVVVEDMRKPSAWKVVENALQYIFSMVLSTKCNSATLTNRMGLSLGATPVQLRNDPLPVSSLVKIPDLPVHVRQGMILREFNCEDVSARILSADVHGDLKLAVIASRFWIGLNRSHTKWLGALVSCIVACLDLQPPRCDDRSLLQGEDKIEFIHTFAQWQCILHHVITLNQVLNNPFPTAAVSSPRLFSAAAVQYYYRNPAKRPNSKEQVLLNAIQ